MFLDLARYDLFQAGSSEPAEIHMLSNTYKIAKCIRRFWHSHIPCNRLLVGLSAGWRVWVPANWHHMLPSVGVLILWTFPCHGFISQESTTFSHSAPACTLSQSPIMWATWLQAQLFGAGCSEKQWWPDPVLPVAFLLCCGSSIAFGERHLQGVSQSYLRCKSKAWHFQRVNQIWAGLNHSLELSINLTSWLSLLTVVPLNCIQTSFFWAWLVPQLIKTSSIKSCISPFSL